MRPPLDTRHRLPGRLALAGIAFRCRYRAHEAVRVYPCAAARVTPSAAIVVADDVHRHGADLLVGGSRCGQSRAAVALCSRRPWSGGRTPRAVQVLPNRTARFLAFGAGFQVWPSPTPMRPPTLVESGSARPSTVRRVPRGESESDGLRTFLRRTAGRGSPARGARHILMLPGPGGGRLASAVSGTATALRSKR